MNQEIERKWLVKSLHDIDPDESFNISQGYIISNKGESVRIRQQVYTNEMVDYFLTIKSGTGLVRNETEIEINNVQFESLWHLTEGKRIYKNRSLVLLPNHLVAEVDIFSYQDGLVLVEVEFPSEEDANNFIPPEWFGVEVTHDSHYCNANLANYGL